MGEDHSSKVTGYTQEAQSLADIFSPQVLPTYESIILNNPESSSSVNRYGLKAMRFTT